MTDFSKDAWKYYEYGKQFNNRLTPNQYRMVSTNREFFNGNQWINMPDNDAMRRLSRPVFNIIKRIVSLFAATLTSTGTAINFSALAYNSGGAARYPNPYARPVQRADIEGSTALNPAVAPNLATALNPAVAPNLATALNPAVAPNLATALNPAAFATAEVANLLEKFKMDYRIRDAMFDAAITGDYCAHFYWNPRARPYGGTFGDYRGEIEMEMVDGIDVMFGNPNITDVEKQPI